MISLSQSKYIRSLHDKKTRIQEGIYLVEGRKILEELLISEEEILSLFLTEEFEQSHLTLLGHWKYEKISEKELEKITTLKSNNAGIALVKMRENILLRQEGNEYILLLDGINDPGNLGTIIRIADWYGIQKIICSPDTVEYTNPKVIMSSMGSFLRVSLYYTDLEEYLGTLCDSKTSQGLQRIMEGDWCRFSPGKGGARGGYTEYNPSLVEYARDNRKQPNDMEKNMWSLLRGSQLGYKFHRQKPIGEYIVDFYSPELQLVIEIDGDSHLNQSDYDEKRTEYINSLGIHVLRFTNTEITNSLEGVRENMLEWVRKIKEPDHVTPPNLPLSGEGSKSSKIYGTYLEGENIHTKKIPTEGGYIVIGSEAHGIRPSLEKYITDKITIPRIGQAESLNAGVATAIIVDNLLKHVNVSLV